MVRKPDGPRVAHRRDPVVRPPLPVHDEGPRPDPRPARIRWGEHVATSSATTGTSWGTLDFGRGRWPYRTTWNWGAGIGLVDGRRVGMQVGGKWTDGTGMTENSLVVDGRLSKISEDLVWEYDRVGLAPTVARPHAAVRPGRRSCSPRTFDKRGRLQRRGGGEPHRPVLRLLGRPHRPRRR